MKEKRISIIAQAFYGNRTATEVRHERIDSFILGNIDGINSPYEKIDRTVIKLPDVDNIVIIYNKYQEEKALKQKAEWHNEDGYVAKPLAVIPDMNIELYSRCIVCRMDDNGNLESLQDGDYAKFVKYLAE